MTLRIDPPFTRRDKAAVALMVLAFAVAIGLVNYALHYEEEKAAARWNEVHHGRR